MASPVNLVTIHHQGAGLPSDGNSGAEGGYTYRIGVSTWTRLRSVSQSFATLHFNHGSMDVMLSGNRQSGLVDDHGRPIPFAPVTDHDIVLLHGAFLDCLHRDEVTDTPLVRDHHSSPGSNTVCPGDQTMHRWADIVAACHPTPVPPKPEVRVKPRYDPPLSIVDKLEVPGKGSWGLQADGGIITFGGSFFGSMAGKPAFKGRTASRLVAAGAPLDGANAPLAHYPASAVYEVVSSGGERYLPVP